VNDSKQAVFLDLNGTLVMPVQPAQLADLELLPGIADAISRLNSNGYACPIVTVQSRIAKGFFSLADFTQWFEAFAASLCRSGAEILGPYVCPHLFSEECPCEKPKTLLYERAAADHAIDLRASWVIGDSASDLQAAAALNARSCLVRTGWGSRAENVAIASELSAPIAASLADAVDVILAS
jgi:D-glycero-D-manno-heptose 1,7-bisphosphate phosphatase